jgi:hypothetical protein
MGLVIGYGTIANMDNMCAANVSWGANPNTQRLYCLNGSFAPFLNITRPTINVNMTIYVPDGGGHSYNVEPSDHCTTQDSVANAYVNIAPSYCVTGGSLPGIHQRMIINSYSVSREDYQLPTQETYGLIRRVENPPSYVIRGIAEGSGTANSGIVFSGATTEATQGSVSAGGVGKADVIIMGAVSSFGGPVIPPGETAQGNVSIPHTPLWV